MGGIQPWHIILVVVVALLLFGGKKLPDAARGLGRSLRIFKSEVSAMQDDKKPGTPAETDQSATMATPASQIAPTPVSPIPVNPVSVNPASVNAAPVNAAQPAGASPVAAPAATPAPMNGVPVVSANGAPIDQHRVG